MRTQHRFMVTMGVDGRSRRQESLLGGWYADFVTAAPRPEAPRRSPGPAPLATRGCAVRHPREGTASERHSKRGSSSGYRAGVNPGRPAPAEATAPGVRRAREDLARSPGAPRPSRTSRGPSSCAGLDAPACPRHLGGGRWSTPPTGTSSPSARGPSRDRPTKRKNPHPPRCRPVPGRDRRRPAANSLGGSGRLSHRSPEGARQGRVPETSSSAENSTTACVGVP